LSKEGHGCHTFDFSFETGTNREDSNKKG